MKLTRRHMLKTAGVSLALPMLEETAPVRAAEKATIGVVPAEGRATTCS